LRVRLLRGAPKIKMIKKILKSSLQNSVVIFFIFILFILLILTFVL